MMSQLTPLSVTRVTLHVTDEKSRSLQIMLILFVFSVGLDYLNDFIKVISFNPLF